MTVAEARALLHGSAPGQARVLYRPVHGDGRCAGEPGVITRVSGDWVFVMCAGEVAAKVTDPADLEPRAVPGWEREADTVAWGGRGSSASYEEWLIEEDGGDA